MPTSVMPKGVEHWDITDRIDASNFMPTSVMPKGVEHVTVSAVPPGLPDAHLCDAERR